LLRLAGLDRLLLRRFARWWLLRGLGRLLLSRLARLLRFVNGHL
jgi:hypothetical protein